MIRKNLKYKLLALAMAVAIWYYANGGQTTREIVVPVEMRNLQAGLTAEVRPTTVRLVFSIPKEQANTIIDDSDTAVAYVNLMNLSTGRHRLPVRVKPPVGLRDALDVRADPGRVEVVIEKRIERVMNVGFEMESPAPVGYRFDRPRLSPSRVTVSGTPSNIDSVDRLLVVIDGAESGVDGDYTVEALGEDGDPVQDIVIVPNRVRVQMEVKEAPATSVLLISPNLEGLPPFPYGVDDVSVEPQTVTVSGKPELLMKVKTVSTEPVRLDKRKSSFTQKVRLAVPDGLSTDDGESVTVTVKISSKRQ